MGLLDEMAAALRCTCLSDLRFRSITPEQARGLLAHPPAGAADLAECRRAADYVLGVSLPWPTSGAALAALVGALLCRDAPRTGA